jgi:hypothetical protein
VQVASRALAERRQRLAYRISPGDRESHALRFLEREIWPRIPDWSPLPSPNPGTPKGRHKARLNFGDCLTYAVARLANEPLLFAGDDFPETDLELA